MPLVRVAPDDIERFAQCKPCAAIEEFIWNGLDAGGTRLDVTFQKRTAGDALEVIDAIEVRDFGTGIPHSEISEDFGSVGGSTKTVHRVTPEGRLRHGQFGRGRFTFLVLGNLHEAQLRYEFFREGLKVEPSSDFGMKRFMKLHRHLMTGKGMTRKAEIAAGKLKRQP